MKQDKKWKGNTPQERAVSIIKGFINQVDTIHIEKAVEEMDDQELFSQQPTEKTREGAIKILVDNSPMGHNAAKRLIDALIQSGYIQSDSVDAEALHDIFYKKYLSYMEHEPEGCMKKAFIETFLSSKVKPVNEKMREAAQEIINLYTFNDSGTKKIDFIEPYKSAWENFESALSTAPDDGWIPVEKELPKEISNVLITDCRIQAIGSYSEKSKQWYTANLYIDYDKISHWQPLPSPPKV